MKTTLIITTVLMLFWATPSTSQPNWVEVSATATPAVVTIEHDAGTGTGFLVSPDGTIVTNEHVIRGADGLTITLSSGEAFHDAYVIMTEPARDLAILRVAGAGLPHLPLSGTPAEVGANVALIGAPQGLDATLTTGIVSATRIIEGSRTIQTTASASPGSSGSPLLNEAGEVIGVLTWKFTTGDDLNFAIPASYVTGLLATEYLGANPRLLRREPARGDYTARSRGRTPGIRPQGGVLLSGGGTEANMGFWDVLRNVQDTLFSLNVTVVNDAGIGDAQMWRAYFRGIGTSNQQMIENAAEAGAAWMLRLDTNISYWNMRDSATLECFSVPAGTVMWREKVTDVAMDLNGAVNDLSRDLARELRARHGEPCVSNGRSQQAEPSHDEYGRGDRSTRETPSSSVRHAVGSWTPEDICDRPRFVRGRRSDDGGFTGTVYTETGHVSCEDGEVTEVVERKR